MGGWCSCMTFLSRCIEASMDALLCGISVSLDLQGAMMAERMMLNRRSDDLLRSERYITD